MLRREILIVSIDERGCLAPQAYQACIIMIDRVWIGQRLPEAYPVVPGSTIGSGCTGLMG